MLADGCQEALDKIVPCLDEAMSTITEITKIDIAELKSMSNPPKMVLSVLKAVCILLEVEPVLAPNDQGKFEPSYWKAALGPHVFGDPNLSGRLQTFDREALTEERMSLVEDIMQDPDYSQKSAEKALKALMSLFKWVQAIRDYYYLFRELAPRRDALVFAEKSYKNNKEELGRKTGNIKDLENHLETLQEHQEEKTKQVEELRVDISETTTRKKRGEDILKSLLVEKQKWIVCSRMLHSKYASVNGDVVMGAAIIIFGGGFTEKYRQILIQKWLTDCL